MPHGIIVLTQIWSKFCESQVCHKMYQVCLRHIKYAISVKSYQKHVNVSLFADPKGYIPGILNRWQGTWAKSSSPLITTAPLTASYCIRTHVRHWGSLTSNNLWIVFGSPCATRKLYLRTPCICPEFLSNIISQIQYQYKIYKIKNKTKTETDKYPWHIIVPIKLKLSMSIVKSKDIDKSGLKVAPFVKYERGRSLPVETGSHTQSVLVLSYMPAWWYWRIYCRQPPLLCHGILWVYHRHL